MGHPRRFYEPGLSHHVIRRGNNRGAIVTDDEDRRRWMNTLRHAARSCHVDVHGCVLMTTHYHLIVTPSMATALQQMMKTLGEEYVPYYNDRHDRIGTLWTGRYRAKPIANESYWLTCLRYVEQNPCRAKMVSTPDQYRWSSCRVHAFGEPSDLLVPHAVYLSLGATPEARQKAYRSICSVPLTDEELEFQRGGFAEVVTNCLVSDTCQTLT